MPKPCPVCQHSLRQEIEKALLGSEKLPVLAQRFALPKWSLYRHKQRHLSATLVKAQEAREVARADSLLDQVKSLQGKALELLGKAEAAGDLRTALVGVRETKGCLELLARLSGELAESRLVTFHNAVVVQVVKIFLQVNELPDPEERKVLFATEFDRLAFDNLAALGVRG